LLPLERAAEIAAIEKAVIEFKKERSRQIPAVLQAKMPRPQITLDRFFSEMLDFNYVAFAPHLKRQRLGFTYGEYF